MKRKSRSQVARAHDWCDDRDDLGEPVRRCIECGACEHWPLGRRPCGSATVQSEEARRSGQLGADRRWAKGSPQREAARARARAMRARGMGYDEIGAVLGCSRQLARLWATSSPKVGA